MPLEELSPNIKKNASKNEHNRSGMAAASSTHSLRSSAVQSMLKNTTELGDTGPFAVRPPRIPRSASRLLPNKRQTRSFDTSFPSKPRPKGSPRRRSQRYHGPRTVPSSSALSGRDTRNSAHTGLHSGLRSKRAGYRHRSHGLNGPGSNGLHPQSLHSHRSMVTLRTQRTFQSMHSNSPMPRMPSHRASSPAYAEAYRHRLGLNQGYPRARSVATIASSPALSHHLRPGLAGYRPELNNSFSSSARLPSPAMSFVNGMPGTGYQIQRSATSMSASLQSLRPTWNHSAASSRGLPRSPTESTGPHYYDYSESFLEEDCFSPPRDPTAASLPFNMDQAIMEDEVVAERRHAQSPFGTMPGSAFKPQELPTSHNRRSSEQSKYSYTGVIPPRKSSLAGMAGLQRPVSHTSIIEKVGRCRLISGF